MRDGRTERALGLGALDVDVDPLVVAAQAGEGIDVILGDLAPGAGADLAAEKLLEPLDSVRGCLRHAGGSVPRNVERRARRPASRQYLTCLLGLPVAACGATALTGRGARTSRAARGLGDVERVRAAGGGL